MRLSRKAKPPIAADGDRAAGAAPVETGEPRRGPWDASEVELDSGEARVDLGGLLLTPVPGLELRLQIDQASQALVSVLLVGPESAVELRAFAAPKDGGLWDEARRQIAADAERQGGTVSESEGPDGPELFVERQVETPEGPRPQPSRVVGFEGPRWLLRATYLGSAVLTPDEAGLVESAVRDVVVVRGTGPMSPGEPLPLRLPPGVLPQPR